MKARNLATFQLHVEADGAIRVSVLEALGLKADVGGSDAAARLMAKRLLAQSFASPVMLQIAPAVPLEEYHEDLGPVLWWRFPVDEPPYCGTPDDSGWPGYHSHFTPIGIVPEAPSCAS